MCFSLHHIEHKCDIHLELPPGSDAIKDAITLLKAKFTQYAGSDKWNLAIKSWLLDGPADDLPHNVWVAVQELRKKMKSFLRLEYTDAASPIPITKVEDFKEFINDMYENVCTKVTSETGMLKAIDSFLAGAGREVDMPIILVTGKGKKQGDQLSLQFSEKNHKFADTIFKQYRQRNDELRMVFCCYNHGSAGDGGEVWFSNALPPETDDSENADLKKYHCAIIKDGPQNKDIQLPNSIAHRSVTCTSVENL